MHDAAAAVSERLRQTYTEWNNPPSAGLPDGAKVLLDAADEIDRLRAAQAGGVPADTEATELRMIRDGVESAIAECSGFWRSCSGCYDTEDGHPTRHYPHSAVFGVDLGCGCSECGGLGAVWDNTDYDEMAREMLADSASPPPPATDGDALREALEDCAEYFDQRADADQPAGCISPIPNEEMSLLIKVRNALASSPPLAATDAVEAERALLDEAEFALVGLVYARNGISTDDPDVGKFCDDRGGRDDTVNRCCKAGLIKQIGDGDSDNFSLVPWWWPYASATQARDVRDGFRRARGTDEVENG